MDRGESTSQVLACERKMYRTAYCMLRNEADCQDAVQETIFSAWRNLVYFNEEKLLEWAGMFNTFGL